MADINPGDLVYLKDKRTNKHYIGWVIGSQYSELWWEVEWADGGISTESAANVREYKKVVDRMRKKR